MTNPDKTVSIKSYSKILGLMNDTYENFQFENEKSKEMFEKRINQIYKSAISTYNKHDNKENVIKSYEGIIDVARKHSYFNFSSFIFTYISKNKFLDNFYKKTTNLIKSFK